MAGAETFAELYERCYPWVYGYLYRRLGHRETAQDLASEVFVKALVKFDAYEDRGVDQQAWLSRIARNVLFDHAKSARVRHEVPAGEFFADETPLSARPGRGPWEEFEHAERCRAVVQTLRRLTEPQRRCLALRFLRDRSVEETAADLGIGSAAARTLQYRAVLSARRNLEGATAWTT